MAACPNRPTLQPAELVRETELHAADVTPYARVLAAHVRKCTAAGAKYTATRNKYATSRFVHLVRVDDAVLERVVEDKPAA